MRFLRHRPGREGHIQIHQIWKEVAAVALLSAIAVALVASRTDLKTIGTAAFADPGWDRHLYREMARRSVFDFQIAPYCWRVLMPLLAKLPPWSTQTGFLTTSAMALVVTGPMTYLLVRAVGGSRTVAVGFVFAFYSLGWAARFAISDFWVPDAMSMAFTCGAMWLVATKRWLAAGIVIAVGVFAKESVIFVAPLAFTWHARSWRDWPAARRALLIGAPAVLFIVLLRLIVQPENGNESYIASMPPEISRFPELFGDYNYVQRYRDIAIDDRWAHRDWGDLDRYFVDPFGPVLLVVAAAGALAEPKRALRLSPFLGLVYSQLLFATDTQRLLVLAFPALAILGATGIHRFGKRLRVSEIAFCGAFGGLFVASLIDANEFGSRFWIEVSVAASCLAVGALAPHLFHRVRKSNATAS